MCSNPQNALWTYPEIWMKVKVTEMQEASEKVSGSRKEGNSQWGGQVPWRPRRHYSWEFMFNWWGTFPTHFTFLHLCGSHVVQSRRAIIIYRYKIGSILLGIQWARGWTEPEQMILLIQPKRWDHEWRDKSIGENTRHVRVSLPSCKTVSTEEACTKEVSGSPGWEK